MHKITLSSLIVCCALGGLFACQKAKETEIAQLEEAKAAAEKALKKAQEAEQAARAAAGKAEEAAGKGAADAPPANLEDAMKQMQAAMGENAPKVDPVPFRDLKALLPESVSDMKRTKFEGEKTAAMGVKVSMAEARYEDGDKRIKLKVVDMGTMKGVAAMAAMSWAGVEIDRESDKGYEKTMSHKGHKGYEKYDSKRERAEMKLVIASRFLVEADGRKVEMKTVKEAIDQIPLDKLVALKDHGLKE